LVTIIRNVGVAVREPVLWDDVVALIDDDDETVRIAAAKLIIETAGCWTEGFAEAHVVAVVIERLLESDNRDIIGTVADGIGKLAHGLSVPVAENYMGLRLHIQKFLALIADGGGSEMMERLAPQFPGLALALGPPHFPDSTFSTLFDSPSVHDAVVSYLHELCVILGPQH
jgi:hypothetical protein